MQNKRSKMQNKSSKMQNKSSKMQNKKCKTVVASGSPYVTLYK